MCCFIWISRIKCLFRIDFKVVSRNLNSSPEVQVIQTDHGLRTHAPAFPSQVICDSRRPLVFLLWMWLIEWSRRAPGISGNCTVFPDKQLFIRKKGRPIRIHHLDHPWNVGLLQILQIALGLLYSQQIWIQWQSRGVPWDQLLLGAGLCRPELFPPWRSTVAVLDPWWSF